MVLPQAAMRVWERRRKTFADVDEEENIRLAVIHDAQVSGRSSVLFSLFPCGSVMCPVKQSADWG